MNKDRKIPESILAAVSTLLTPFNVNIRELLANDHGKEVNDNKDTRTFLGIAETERCFGISRCTLYRLIKAGKIKASKLSAARSGKVLINRASVEDYVANRSVGLA